MERIHLNDAQKKHIIAEYATGKVSMKELAKKYGCSVTLIHKTVHADTEFKKKCEEEAKAAEIEAAASLRKYFAENQAHAAEVVKKLLDIPQELIDASTLRERVGAASYIKDMFMADGVNEEREPINVTLTVKDLTEGAPDAEP